MEHLSCLVRESSLSEPFGKQLRKLAPMDPLCAGQGSFFCRNEDPERTLSPVLLGQAPLSHQITDVLVNGGEPRPDVLPNLLIGRSVAMLLQVPLDEAEDLVLTFGEGVRWH